MLFSNVKQPFNVSVGTGRPLYHLLDPVTPHAMVGLIVWMLNPTPSERPPMEAVLAHPAFWHDAHFAMLSVALKSRLEDDKTIERRIIDHNNSEIYVQSCGPGGTPLWHAQPVQTYAANWRDEFLETTWKAMPARGPYDEKTLLKEMHIVDKRIPKNALGLGVYLRHFFSHAAEIRCNADLANALTTLPYTHSVFDSRLEYVLRHPATAWFWPWLWRSLYSRRHELKPEDHTLYFIPTSGVRTAAIEDEFVDPRVIAVETSLRDPDPFACAAACKALVLYLGGHGGFNLDHRKAVIEQDGSTLEWRTQAVILAGMPVAAVAALRKHTSDASVAEQGLQGLINIAAYREGKEAVIAANAIPVVISVLRQHIDVAQVAKQGCRALANLAYHVEGKRIAVHEGALTAILSVMMKHAGMADVARYGCWALERIHAIGEVPEMFSPSVSTIVEAMTNHRSDPAVMLSALRALNKITRFLAGQTAAISEKVPFIIVTTIIGTPGCADDNVAEVICWLLSNIAISPEGRNAIIDAGGKTKVADFLKDVKSSNLKSVAAAQTALLWL